MEVSQSRRVLVLASFHTDHLSTIFLILALIHTFLVSYFAKISVSLKQFPLLRILFSLLSEVELAFGIWAITFLLIWLFRDGSDNVFEFCKNLNITEPLFIFCIIVMASVKPILQFARKFIVNMAEKIAQTFKVDLLMTQFLILFILGPLLGSILTEPAAITITALTLIQMCKIEKVNTYFLYALVGLLFVNISVGGALTPFAAPPILVVARTWNWNAKSVFLNLGLPAMISVILNAVYVKIKYKKEILIFLKPLKIQNNLVPSWVASIHFLLLLALIVCIHQPLFLLAVLVLFVIYTKLTKKFQEKLHWKESFLVAFFLMGLLILGSFQRWWLEPLLIGLSNRTVFFAAVALTAVTDNAALTYLASQVSVLKESAKWALVSGALAGGGLTILANAPNPIGFSLLSSKFPMGLLNSGKLFVAAVVPTIITVICFLIFS